MVSFSVVHKVIAIAVFCLAASAAAQDSRTVPPAQSAAGSEADSEIGSGHSSRTFRASEAVLIRVPLDTASVLNGFYPVDSAGYVTLPIAGRLFVHDLSSRQVEEFLAKRMSQYLRDTHVTATPMVRLTMLGYWQRPGMHYVDPELSIWEACRVVGGPAGETNMDKWLVMRGSQSLGIPLLDEFSRGTTLRGAGVRSGDIFVIPQPNPQSGFWYWFRETLTVTAQIAGIVGTTLAAYVTFLVLDERSNQ
jgi:protein involved in polysaccharide export with SLBB domain